MSRKTDINTIIDFAPTDEAKVKAIFDAGLVPFKTFRALERVFQDRPEIWGRIKGMFEGPKTKMGPVRDVLDEALAPKSKGRAKKAAAE